MDALAPGLENASELLGLIARGQACSRSELSQLTGLSRVTVAQRLGALFEAGLVQERQQTVPSGGRPSRVLGLNHEAYIMLVGDIGESFVHLAAMDTGRAILAQSTIQFSTTENPTNALAIIAAELRKLSEADNCAQRHLLGACLSLPTPVDHRTGRVVGPSVLSGWDDLDIIGCLSNELAGIPVFVENDVNLMTLYECRQNYPGCDDMFFVKAGTGIGSGIVANGMLFRGAQGAAGDIGHIQLNTRDAPLCRCGKLGCLEAHAAGWAMARDLRNAGYEAQGARDVIEMVIEGKPEAVMYLRNASRTIGEVIAEVVSILNPQLIVVGGTLALAGELLASGIRELVYQRCLPLATRELRIAIAEPFAERALHGAAFLLYDEVFSVGGVSGLIRRSTKPPSLANSMTSQKPHGRQATSIGVRSDSEISDPV